MKKYLILFMLCTSLAWAGDEDRAHQYIIESFAPGLNSHTSEFALKSGEASNCLNVRFNKEFGAVSKRDSIETFGSVGSTKLTGLYRYYKSDDTASVIATSGSTLEYGDDTLKTFANIRTGLSDGKRWTFCTYQDNVIGMNGTDNAQKWDMDTNSTDNTTGHRTADYLSADLGAPFANLTTGTTLDASSWYQYKIVIKTPSVIYYSDARSNPIKTGAAVHDLYLSDIPLGPSGTTQRQIYRTEGQASAAAAQTSTTFKLVAAINNNTSTIYNDSTADGSLGAALSTSGSSFTPPTGKYCAIHHERLFISGNNTNKSDLNWSDPFNPDFFAATEYDQVRPDDGDEITFIKTFLGILTVGKTNTITKYFTEASSTTDWYNAGTFSKDGCPSPYSAAVTPLGIIYNGRHGLYAFNGRDSKLLSDKVTPEILDISQAYIEDVFGIYWNNEYHMAYTSNESGSAINDKILIFDLVRDAFSLDDKKVNCMAALESGNDYGALYFGSSETGAVTKIGTSEPGLYVRYKSEIDSGSISSVNTFGSELAPELELAWDVTIDGAEQITAYNLTIDGATSESGTRFLIDRPYTFGNWQSDVYQINADTLDKIKWNERLNSYGDVTLQMRLSDSSTNVLSADFGDLYTSPSGSDVSGVTAQNYIQLKANLSTTNILYTPEMYVDDNYFIKLTYSQEGVVSETTMNSFWESGWMDLMKAGFETQLVRIKIFYKGTEGTLTCRYWNEDGDIDNSFDIDLAQSPPYTYNDSDDAEIGRYTGDETNKIYTYYVGWDGDEAPIGHRWKLKISDGGIVRWDVNRCELIYYLRPLTA